ncbi:acetolactate synthase [Filobacillus milosensis]|uniref:Acetolactate synthase n=1 Tax=Filobacillus milosensis TaxID=94137 RepID=A0A4Y8IVZ7_9BACI|nr:thiamine pyrophosphate-dependent enzyme [Filobacillus milosensis]TFB24488.1 acetolactate synthase [Filobacillus milosensis]
MNAGKAVVEFMKREGTSKVFCVPGESYLPILDALYDESSIQLISNRHEGGAAFMAEGYAKASGKPGVVMATRGVGAANLSIGVHTAMQDSTPMIVLLGQVHSQFRGREGFQEVDLDQFFKPICKWAVEVQDAERIPELMQRAYRVAQSGRPGPVVLSFPEDVLREHQLMTFGHSYQPTRPKPSTDEIEMIKSCLSTAEKPIVIAGGGIKLSGAENAFEEFIDQYQIPVLSAFRRHDVLRNDHPSYVGHLGLGTHADIKDILKQADVVLAIGTRLSEVTTQDYSIISNEQKLIHIDISDDVIGKSFIPFLGVQSDAKVALEGLTSIDFQHTWSLWTKLCREVYEEVIFKPIQALDPINRHIIELLQKHLPGNSILTNDAGNFAGWLHSFYQFNDKNTYVGPTSGAMGYGVPAAVGAKLACPDKVVASLSGDGGFMMTMQEVETAVRYQIPVIHLVFNNEMYGTIRMHQEKHYPERVVGTNLGQVAFSEIAKHMGAQGCRVNDISSFESALLDALNHQGPTVIEIMTEPEHISVSSTIESLRQSRG